MFSIVHIGVLNNNDISFFFFFFCCVFVFFQAEDGIRDLVRSRGLGDVYKRQVQEFLRQLLDAFGVGGREQQRLARLRRPAGDGGDIVHEAHVCLLYTSDAADERSSVDLGGRRLIKKQNKDC